MAVLHDRLRPLREEAAVVSGTVPVEQGGAMAKSPIPVFILLLTLFCVPEAAAQQQQPAPGLDEPVIQTAPVMLDDALLFKVRGIMSFPAEERARGIVGRIRDVAADPGVKTDSIVAVESAQSTDIVAGSRHIVSIFDADAALEGMPRQVVARGYVLKLRAAVDAYRHDRSPGSLIRGIVSSLFALAGLVAALFLLRRLYRKLYSLLEARYKARIHAVHIKSFEIIQAERLWTMVTGTLKTVRTALIFLVLYLCLYFVLRSFPWTRLFAANLLGYVLTPLKKIGASVAAAVPNMIFIAILVLISRYVLKLMRLFFLGIEKGTLTLSGFDPDWARPTYKIVRVLVVVFAAVVAYPYIPGSESPAFKGISLFLGVVLSLGSSSAIANIIAGYAMTYRRAFKVGDRVKIGDVMGDVTDIRLQVTHLRTVKNEEVVVPNSTILNSHVINYSSLSREKGLILHTTVTIGYDVPWRQVNALLLMAAERTQGLLKEPRPFVFLKSLDDFYVTYELNAYTDTPQGMARYSDLHRNILDAFNEFGVQIMSPGYESDPDRPKVVPREQWYTPPAKPPEDSGAGKGT
jgi:small-conductance mechanosensitive channel